MEGLTTLRELLSCGPGGRWVSKRWQPLCGQVLNLRPLSVSQVLIPWVPLMVLGKDEFPLWGPHLIVFTTLLDLYEAQVRVSLPKGLLAQWQWFYNF